MFKIVQKESCHCTGLSAPSFGENAQEDRLHMSYGRKRIPDQSDQKWQNGNYGDRLSKCRNAIDKWVDMVFMKVKSGLKVTKLN